MEYPQNYVIWLTDEPMKFVRKQNIGMVDIDTEMTGSPGQTQSMM